MPVSILQACGFHTRDIEWIVVGFKYSKAPVDLGYLVVDLTHIQLENRAIFAQQVHSEV